MPGPPRGGPAPPRPDPRAGYAPEGEIRTAEGDAVARLDGGSDGDLHELLTAAALANDSRLVPPKKGLSWATQPRPRSGWQPSRAA